MLVPALRASRGAARNVLVASRAFASDAASVDATAHEAIKNNPLFFRNISIDNINFNVGQHFVTGEAYPQVYLGKNERSGIMHLTPLSSVMFPRFSMSGNFGTKKNFASGSQTVDDLKDAELELTLSAPTAAQLQADFVDYIAWLKAIQGKYVEHLSANLANYPSLKRKFGFVSGKPEVLREMLNATAGAMSKPTKDDKGEPVPNADVIAIRQKIYNRREGARLNSVKTRCAIDEEMKARGFARNYVPLFDSVGLEVPIEDVKLGHNDLVTVQNTLSCNLYEVAGNVGFTMKRAMNSVVLVRKAQRAENSRTQSSGSPFIISQ